MSLADLPIETLALIQAFFAANIDYMDTRIVNLSRVTRAKLRKYTWPTLYIDKLTAQNAAVLAAYKFSGVVITNVEYPHHRDIIQALCLCPTVEMMYGDGNIYCSDGIYVNSSRRAEITNIVNVHTIVITGRFVDIKVSKPYKLIIVPAHKTCELTLNRATPTSIEIAGRYHYPYAQRRRMRATRVNLTVNRTKVSTIDFDPLHMHIKSTFDEICTHVMFPEKYVDALSMFSERYVLDVIKQLGVRTGGYDSYITDMLTGDSDRLSVIPKDIDMDQLVEMIHKTALADIIDMQKK